MIEFVEILSRETVVVDQPAGGETIVIEQAPAIEIMEAIEQGPPGEPGIPGPAGGQAMEFIVASAIGGHRLLAIDAANEIIYAGNDLPGTANKIIGMSVNAAAPGGALSVVRAGEVDEPSWSWDVSKPIYLGINGLLTQATPVLPAAFSLIVGFPLTPTSLFLSLREPITLS